MKMDYTSPEAKLLCFVPAERLANSSKVAFDDLVTDQYGKGTETSVTDIEFDLTL